MEDAPASGLLPGAYVNVAMTTPSDPSLLTVPSQALLFRAGGPQVALIEGDRVRLHGVTLGDDLGLIVQILAGLSRSDRFVANPSLGLLDGARIQPVEAVPGCQPTGGAPPAPERAASANETKAAGDPAGR